MPNPPKLSDAVVERGTDWFREHDTMSGLDIDYSEAPLSFLTAALRLDDPETVERLARAMFAREAYASRPLPRPDLHWGNEPEWSREVYRKQARAAISALLGADPEETDEDRS